MEKIIGAKICEQRLQGSFSSASSSSMGMLPVGVETTQTDEHAQIEADLQLAMDTLQQSLEDSTSASSFLQMTFEITNTSASEKCEHSVPEIWYGKSALESTLEWYGNPKALRDAMQADEVKDLVLVQLRTILQAEDRQKAIACEKCGNFSLENFYEKCGSFLLENFGEKCGNFFLENFREKCGFFFLESFGERCGNFFLENLREKWGNFLLENSGEKNGNNCMALRSDVYRDLFGSLACEKCDRPNWKVLGYEPLSQQSLENGSNPDLESSQEVLVCGKATASCDHGADLGASMVAIAFDSSLVSGWGYLGTLLAPSWLSWLSQDALAPSCVSEPSRGHFDAILGTASDHLGPSCRYL